MPASLLCAGAGYAFVWVPSVNPQGWGHDDTHSTGRRLRGTEALQHDRDHVGWKRVGGTQDYVIDQNQDPRRTCFLRTILDNHLDEEWGRGAS